MFGDVKPINHNTAGTAGIKACGEETSIPVCYTDGQVSPKDPETGRKQETADYEKVAGRSEARDFSHG